MYFFCSAFCKFHLLFLFLLCKVLNEVADLGPFLFSNIGVSTIHFYLFHFIPEILVCSVLFSFNSNFLF